MIETFRSSYAEAYDWFYRDKDYDAECDLIEEIFRRYAAPRPRSVLDLGCGTGGHSARLAARGYRVVGVDRSSAMLEVARAKAEESGVDVRFVEGDVAEVDAGARFESALLMFAVLSYKLSNHDVRATLANVCRHLEPGGILVFDVWHGPGVLSDPPASRVKQVETPRGLVTRRATPSLDVRRSVCAVDYRLEGEDGSVLSSERHLVRFFFPLELELLLELSGLE
ncbi:MAG: class I SAM-dependent DNA methyltransferase, partial [Gaiellaceae bacterium]